MSKRVYIEKQCLHHERVQHFLMQYPSMDVIECNHYQEIFNPKGSQNFKIQKQAPAYIIAKKEGQRIYETPENFGIGGTKNYYFSHLLNCPYDCRYCFLQGMYASANYVWFINYEDFQNDIKALVKQHENSYFFSGYDADSLALNKQTQFLESFVPFFQQFKMAKMELRTKSANVSHLLKIPSSEHIICAFSLSPDVIVNRLEHRTATLKARLKAIKQCADHGWPIGLRFDPIIYCHDYKKYYQHLVEQVFEMISKESVHSVSVGPLRFPKDYFQTIKKLYPEEPLFAQYFEQENGVLTYPKNIEKSVTEAVIAPLKDFGIQEEQLFRCYT